MFPAQKQLRQQVVPLQKPKIIIRRVAKKKAKVVPLKLIVSLSLILTIGVLFVLNNDMTIYALNAENQSLQEEIHQKNAQRDYLRSMRHDLSMENIEDIARHSLGMEFPASDQIIYKGMER